MCLLAVGVSLLEWTQQDEVQICMVFLLAAASSRLEIGA